MKHLCALAIAALIAGCDAGAQTGTVKLTWTAPVAYTNSTLIGSATITYNLYSGKSTLETLATAGVISGVTVSAPAPGTTTCWQVSAVVAGIESGRSNEVCRTSTGLTPNPPTGLTAQ